MAIGAPRVMARLAAASKRFRMSGGSNFRPSDFRDARSTAILAPFTPGAAMNRFVTNFLVVAALAGGPVSAAPCKLSDLQWMAGVWRNADGGAQTEERWSVAPGGRLMGSSWTLHADRPGGVIEALTIQDDGAGVAMRLRHFDATLDHAREAQDAPMVFVASDCGANSVVFDGQGAQMGEHMTYRRSGDDLLWTGDFLHGGQPVHVEVHSQKTAQ